MYTELDYDNWDLYDCIAYANLTCLEDEDEYFGYEQNKEPNWHKFVQYEDSK